MTHNYTCGQVCGCRVIKRSITAVQAKFAGSLHHEKKDKTRLSATLSPLKLAFTLGNNAQSSAIKQIRRKR